MMNFDSVGATMNDDIIIILIDDDSEKTTHLTKPFIFKKLYSIVKYLFSVRNKLLLDRSTYIQVAYRYVMYVPTVNNGVRSSIKGILFHTFPMFETLLTIHLDSNPFDSQEQNQPTNKHSTFNPKRHTKQAWYLITFYLSYRYSACYFLFAVRCWSLLCRS